MTTIATQRLDRCSYFSANGQVTGLAVTVLQIPRSSVPRPFKLLADGIVARLDGGDSGKALGIVFRVNMGMGLTPSLLDGMLVEGDGLILPPGCRASVLEGYSGMVSDLNGKDGVVLTLAFDAKLHGRITALEFSDYPDLVKKQV
jgi:hypothetical protein